MEARTKHQFQLIANLRYYQKMYYRTKSTYILNECKILEIKIDEILHNHKANGIIESSMQNLQKKEIQINLF